MPRKILTYILLLFFSVMILIPFAYLLCSALKSPEDFFTSLFLPGGDGPLGIAWTHLTFDNFSRVLSQPSFPRSLLNSFFYSSVTATVATLACAMAGYALACYHFPGRRFLRTLILTSLVMPPVLLLSPVYQLLFRLQLLDTVWAFILPSVAPAFGVYLFRQYMLTAIPPELLEAARIDGSSEFRIFFTIVLPLARPMIGAFLLLTFLATWNNYITPQVVLQSPEHYPLSVSIAQLKGVYSQDYGLLMAGTVISILPVLLLFLLLQRDFITGLTTGAVKA
jgi:multiple sugar transport system permease protein